MADKRFFIEQAELMMKETTNKAVIKQLNAVKPMLDDVFKKTPSYTPLKNVRQAFESRISKAKTRAEKDTLANCFDRGADYYHAYYKQVRAERNKIALAYTAEKTRNDSMKKPTAKTTTAKKTATAEKTTTAKTATAKKPTEKKTTAKTTTAKTKKAIDKANTALAKSKGMTAKTATATAKKASKK